MSLVSETLSIFPIKDQIFIAGCLTLSYFYELNANLILDIHLPECYSNIRAFIIDVCPIIKIIGRAAYIGVVAMPDFKSFNDDIDPKSINLTLSSKGL